MVQYALIVAGGKGLRMGCELPKQFLPIGGKPVLMRTIEAFYAYNAEIRIILVPLPVMILPSFSTIAAVYSAPSKKLSKPG